MLGHTLTHTRIPRTSIQKLWQLSHRFDRTLTNNPDLKILKYFKPEEEFVLNPGMFIFTAHVAHNGIAIQDTSITYSIGLRTPIFWTNG